MRNARLWAGALALILAQGVAPETMTATLYRNNDPAKGVASERKWPAVSADKL